MSFYTLGISHTTAPVAIRERLSFSAEQIPVALADLRKLPGVTEAAIVSTCNRTEIYAHLDNAPDAALADWLAAVRGSDDPEVRARFYAHSGAAAARHLFRVASGLDSMILGEPQILGQIKQAYELAQSNGGAGNMLHRLFQQAFAVAKQVRTDTPIGSNPVSVAYAAVHLARQIFADFGRLTALLIGAGETVELAVRHLRQQGTQRMIIANRTLSRAHHLAEEVGGYAIGLHEIPVHLPEADIVIAASGSPEPLLTRATVAAALKTRKHRPMLMVDIAVPRDIDPAAAELSDVYLFTIDDLQHAVEDGLRSRREAAKEAEVIIEAQVRHFMEQMRGLDAVPTIRAVRDNATLLRDRTLEQAEHLLAGGTPAADVLRYLAETLTNRLLHAPTAYLKQAAHQGRSHVIREVHELFGLDDPYRDDEPESRR